MLRLNRLLPVLLVALLGLAGCITTSDDTPARSAVTGVSYRSTAPVKPTPAFRLDTKVFGGDISPYIKECAVTDAFESVVVDRTGAEGNPALMLFCDDMTALWLRDYAGVGVRADKIEAARITHNATNTTVRMVSSNSNMTIEHEDGAWEAPSLGFRSKKHRRVEILR